MSLRLIKQVKIFREQILRAFINYILSCLSYLILFPESSFKSNWVKGVYFLLLSIITGSLIRNIFSKNESLNQL